MITLKTVEKKSESMDSYSLHRKRKNALKDMRRFFYTKNDALIHVYSGKRNRRYEIYRHSEKEPTAVRLAEEDTLSNIEFFDKYDETKERKVLVLYRRLTDDDIRERFIDARSFSSLYPINHHVFDGFMDVITNLKELTDGNTKAKPKSLRSLALQTAFGTNSKSDNAYKWEGGK